MSLIMKPFYWIKDNIIPIELALVLLGLMAGGYSIHVSRTISLETEEHNLLLAFISNLPEESIISQPPVRNRLRDYENARWDWIGHKREIELWRFSYLSRDSCNHNAEAQLLCRHVDFTLRDLQTYLNRAVPGELERILKLTDRQSAAKSLEALAVTGYYAELFDSWEDARSQLEGVVHDNSGRSALSELFNSMNDSHPRRRAGR
jgi:hypothetical protein